MGSWFVCSRALPAIRSLRFAGGHLSRSPSKQLCGGAASNSSGHRLGQSVSCRSAPAPALQVLLWWPVFASPVCASTYSNVGLLWWLGGSTGHEILAQLGSKLECQLWGDRRKPVALGSGCLISALARPKAFQVTRCLTRFHPQLANDPQLKGAAGRPKAQVTVRNKELQTRTPLFDPLAQ